ncbi:hypothetical protein QNI19_24350 [Cytophagaceae bacterium DM2B3-1]|uniref:Lipocalin-like domain-containing protein n=1 Tax=Xanthocytophaga flava TaxID=3048013 RepID=A0ABT7CQS8_9BACT|nr:hypothetical protein [Xanthocytophaga flavus]MDJ1496090.1 hypothetical protein [Xanthocytophaga flavus]
MKTSAFRLFCFILAIAFSSCKKDSNDPAPGNSSLGTFVGNIQVVDDPQTQLGYIYNAEVSVTTSGSDATVKITGDPGFEREYTGKVTTRQDGLYDITLSKQTKPAEKVAGERVVIINNKLTISLDVANDNVTVRKNTTTNETLQITGKISMIGTDMLIK